MLTDFWYSTPRKKKNLQNITAFLCEAGCILPNCFVYYYHKPIRMANLGFSKRRIHHILDYFSVSLFGTVHSELLGVQPGSQVVERVERRIC